VSSELISRVTDAVADEVQACGFFRNRGDLRKSDMNNQPEAST